MKRALFLIATTIVLLTACVSRKQEVPTQTVLQNPTQLSYGARGKIIYPVKNSELTGEEVEPVTEEIAEPLTASLENEPSAAKKVGVQVSPRLVEVEGTEKQKREIAQKDDKKRKPEELDSRNSKKADSALWLAILLYTPFIFYFFVLWPLAMRYGKQGMQSSDPKKVKKAKIARILAIVWLVLIIALIVVMMIRFSQMSLSLSY